MFLWQDFVSDRCYLFFHLFSSIVDFFENYAMREIEGLSLFSSRGGGGGVDSHMKQTGMLVVSLRGVNFGFWSRLGCSGQSANILSRQGLI